MNFDKEKLFTFLRKEILEYYRSMYALKKTNMKIHRRGRGVALPNYINGLLFSFARTENLFPMPEYMPFDDSNQRIDMLWTNRDGIQIAAFEIDQTIYPKSISKLLRLPATCRKFIISAGSGKYPLPDILLQNMDIEHLDITQTTLGVAKHFDNDTF